MFCFPFKCCSDLITFDDKGGTGKPEVSQSLKTPASHVVEWLNTNIRFLFIMTAVLAVVHPHQYNAGFEMLTNMRCHPNMLREPDALLRVLSAWHFPFTGVSIICNRQTPAHRDAQANPYWYDVLATLGSYEDLDFHLTGLGLSFSYRPGTVVALCGKILCHAAEKIQQGDRVCFAWFMRDDVRKYLGVGGDQPSTVSSILQMSVDGQQAFSTHS